MEVDCSGKVLVWGVYVFGFGNRWGMGREELWLRPTIYPLGYRGSIHRLHSVAEPAHSGRTMCLGRVSELLRYAALEIQRVPEQSRETMTMAGEAGEAVLFVVSPADLFHGCSASGVAVEEFRCRIEGFGV